MKLADMQSAFQDALLSGSDGILAHIPDSPREKKDVLFSVYRDAYVLRLLGILREDFERLHTYVGDDAFETAARTYIAAHPSHTPNARYYGQSFPEFIAATGKFKPVPMIAAIAALEGALNEIFDGADTEPLSLADLSVFEPDDFARLTFTAHPSVRRLDAPAGLEAIFAALSSGATPPADPREGREQMLVWRKALVPHYRVLPYEESMMWDEACNGAAFGTLCEMLATYDDPSSAAVRAAGHLQGWITSGLLAKAKLAR